jgi:hypothetical protein
MDIANRCPLCDLPLSTLVEPPNCNLRCADCAGAVCACNRMVDHYGIEAIVAGSERLEVWPIERAVKHFGTSDTQRIQEIDRQQLSMVSRDLSVQWREGAGVLLRHLSWESA